MIPPASCWSASGDDAPGAAGRRVVRVQRGRGEQDRHGEERVQRHLRGRRTGPAPGSRAATAPGRARRPATRTAAPRRGTGRARGRWTPRVLEGEVEQRREVADPHDAPRTRATRRPGSDSRRTTVEWSTGRSQRRRTSGVEARRSRVIGAASSRSGGRDEHQQQVLDHVHREQRGVVGGDPGVHGVQDREHADHPVGRPAAGDRVERMRPVRPLDPHAPQQQREHRRQPGQRVERPAEQQARGVGRHRDRGAVRQDGRGQGEHRDATGADAAAAARTNRRRTALPGERAGGRATGLTGSILAPRADAVRAGGTRLPTALVPARGTGLRWPAGSARRV